MGLAGWLSVFVDLHGSGQARGQARRWRRLLLLDALKSHFNYDVATPDGIDSPSCPRLSRASTWWRFKAA